MKATSGEKKQTGPTTAGTARAKRWSFRAKQFRSGKWSPS